jgi:hypothetical protein
MFGLILGSDILPTFVPLDALQALVEHLLGYCTRRLRPSGRKTKEKKKKKPETLTTFALPAGIGENFAWEVEKITTTTKCLDAPIHHMLNDPNPAPLANLTIVSKPPADLRVEAWTSRR